MQRVFFCQPWFVEASKNMFRGTLHTSNFFLKLTVGACDCLSMLRFVCSRPNGPCCFFGQKFILGVSKGGGLEYYIYHRSAQIQKVSLCAWSTYLIGEISLTVSTSIKTAVWQRVPAKLLQKQHLPTSGKKDRNPLHSLSSHVHLPLTS